MWAGSTGFNVIDVEVFVVQQQNLGESNMLTNSHLQQLQTFINRPLSDFDLCYRASEHGYNGFAFHKKCDFKSPTVTIIKSSKGNN